MLSARKLAQLSRTLISKCGGLEEAAQACRLSKSALGNAQSANHDYSLSIDVVHDLEVYCSDPVISRALFEFAPVAAVNDPLHLSLIVTRDCAQLSDTLHRALADNVLTSSEKVTLSVKIREACAKLSVLERSLHPDEGAAS